jgi:hypothetical protein
MIQRIDPVVVTSMQVAINFQYAANTLAFSQMARSFMMGDGEWAGKN